MQSCFHLALNVSDLNRAREFYGTVLGCREGRSTETWVDFDFFGHQLSLHLGTLLATENTGQVGEHQVPMPHFGVLLPLDDWQNLAERLAQSGVEFVISPTVRFQGEAGEQHTMFFRDPFNNPIEIKGLADFSQVYQQ